MLLRSNQAQFVVGIEIVVDAYVVLITIDLIAISVSLVKALLTAREINQGGIQTVRIQVSVRNETVWRRHPPQFLLKEWRIRNCSSIRIAECLAVGDRSSFIHTRTKQPDCGGLTGIGKPTEICSGRPYRITEDIDTGIRARGVGRIDAGPIPEDAGLCRVGQRETVCLGLFEIALAFEQGKEESLLFDDRSTKTNTVLITVIVAL